MVLDHNTMALTGHYAAVEAVQIRATAVAKMARLHPALVAGMYAAFPTMIHDLPLGQVAQVAEDLCDNGYHSVIADMSENRTIRKEYREVLEAVVLGEMIVL